MLPVFLATTLPFAHPAMVWAAVTGADATTLGIDPAHTYSQPTAAIAPPLGLKWSRPISGHADYAIVAGGRVFATIHNPSPSTGTTLVAFDGATGAPSWTPKDLGGSQPYSGLTYDQGSLFAVNSDLTVSSFDPALGTLKWSKSFAPGHLGSAPLATAGQLYVASASNGLFTIGEATGGLLWRGSAAPYGYDTVAVTPTAVYMTNLLNTVALRPGDGSQLWALGTGESGGGQSEAAISAGRVYVSARPSEVTLDASSGRAVGAISAGMPAFGGNYVFTAHGNAISAEDATSSRFAWRYAATSNLVGRPIYANGYVYVLTQAGSLLALKATTGAVAWSMPIGGVDYASQVTVGDDQLVVTTSTAVLDLAGTGPSSPAPASLNPAPAQAPPAASSDQFSGFQGGATHTGRIGPDTLTPPLTLRWSLAFGGEVTTPLLVSGAAIVEYQPNDGLGARMYAVDLQTGKGRWGPVDIGGQNPMMGAYQSGKIFTLTPDGVLRAFDVTNGAPLWATMLAGVQADNSSGLWAAFVFDDPPVAANGLVYVRGAGDGSTLFAVRATDGSVTWKLLSDVGTSAAAPTVDAQRVYIDEPGSYTAAYNQATGQPLWRTLIGTVNGDVPAAVGPVNLYSDSTNAMFNAAGGARVRGLDQPCLSPTLANGDYYELMCVLYNGTFTGRIDAHSASSGSLLWSFSGDGRLQSAPLVVGGELYVVSAGGTLYWINSTNGHLDGDLALGRTFGLSRSAGEYWWTIAGGQGVVAVPVRNRLLIFGGA